MKRKLLIKLLIMYRNVNLYTRLR